MAASDHLGIQFSYRDTGQDHSIVGSHPETGHPVAYLDWSKSGGSRFGKSIQPGEVTSLFVHPDYRRQGMATQMWGMAREHDPGIRHSSDQSADGRAWASSVG